MIYLEKAINYAASVPARDEYIIDTENDVFELLENVVSLLTFMKKQEFIAPVFYV